VFPLDKGDEEIPKAAVLDIALPGCVCDRKLHRLRRGTSRWLYHSSS